MCKWDLSLAMPSVVSNFKKEQKLASNINKLKKFPFKK